MGEIFRTDALLLALGQVYALEQIFLLPCFSFVYCLCSTLREIT